MKTQRHPHNFIWLLLLVWLSVALPAGVFALSDTTDSLGKSKQATLRVYTETDDIALPPQQKLQEAEEAFIREASITTLLSHKADVPELVGVIIVCFIPLRIFRYRRRRTRTPAFSHRASLQIN